MAGNSQASPVLIAVNALNTVVTEVEGLLAGLSGYAAEDLRYPGIFSQAAFAAIGRQLLRAKPGQFDLGNRAQLRLIILEAALIAEELIGVHSLSISIDRRRLNAIIDDVVVVVSATVAQERAIASRAKDPVELARLITRWKVYANGTVSHDIREAANGRLSGRQLVAAYGQVDQESVDEILHIPLPLIVAEVADQILTQNDFLTNVPVKLTQQNEGTGTFLLEAISSNKRLFPDGSISVKKLGNGRFHLSFYPAEDQVGAAQITLRATDTAGGFAEQIMKVTVNPAVDTSLQGIHLNDEGLLTILGTAGNDSIVVEQSEGQLTVSTSDRRLSIIETFSVSDVRRMIVRLGRGDDSASVKASVGMPLLVFGNDGNDRISAGSEASVIFGGAGNDVLRGGRANDVLAGDGGNDRIFGNAGDDRLLGGEGDDRLSGGDGRDHLQGGKGNDSLSGDAGDDVLQREGGNDRLDGGSGNDQMKGGVGDDRLSGKGGNDLLIGGADKDVLRGVSGNDLLIGGHLSIADDTAAMQAIFSEWTATRGHASRVANLRRGVGLNNQFKLGRETVSDDSAARDRVIGGSDIDWFFSSAKDVIVDFRSRIGESRDSV
jgi:Ca2+-binding RTX toxin-like protein